MKPFPTFQLEDCAPGWVRRRTESLYDGQYIQLEKIHYRTPGRPDEDTIWTVARRKNAVIVAPMTSDGKFLLVRQERLPIQRTLWEFPAGQIDDTANSDSPAVILDTVHRELHEETHHHLDPENGELIPCGFYFSSQGFTDEHAYLFLAKNVVKDETVDGGLGEESECIHEARAFSLEELRQLIADNVIIDANTLALFARMTAMRLIEP